ncbi:MAG: hypothetical protein ACYC6Y_25190 [Thermoguttaceae bacterium]
MQASPSVLIVDRSEENRAVLETALEKRGIRAFSASRAARGAAMARAQQPDLIVLDLEVERCGIDALCSKFAGDATCQEPSMLLLGSIHVTPSGSRSEIVSKPYHYGALIRKIEEILGKQDRDKRESA